MGHKNKLVLELYFLCTALPLNSLYQCTKFHSISFSCFELCSRQNSGGQTDRQTDRLTESDPYNISDPGLLTRLGFDTDTVSVPHDLVLFVYFDQRDRVEERGYHRCKPTGSNCIITVNWKRGNRT